MAYAADLGVRMIVRRCSDKSQLPVISTPGGKQFVISEADCEYEVVVRTDSRFPVYNSPMAAGVQLSIDGHDVGYYKAQLQRNDAYTFEGFCMSASDTASSAYRKFKFTRADPSQDHGPEVTDPEQIQAGRITIKVILSREAGQRTGPPGATGAGASGAAAGHLPEGKKFFLAPSLKTGTGQLETKQVQVLGVIELRYETASTLMLRNHLNKANPQHMVLLRSSRDPTVRALLGSSDDVGEDQGSCPPKKTGGAGISRAAGQKQAGVKRERGSAAAAGAASGAAGAGDGARVKPEPGTRVKPEPGTGGSTVFLDLTKPPEMPLKVGGHVVGTDEVAVCDLADSDDEGAAGPRWEVHKKQAVEVEETEAT